MATEDFKLMETIMAYKKIVQNNFSDVYGDEPSDFILVKDGIVVNIIRAHQGFIDTIKNEYDYIQKRELNDNIHMGTQYVNGAFVIPTDESGGE